MTRIALILVALAGCGDDGSTPCLVRTPTGLEPVRGAEFGALEPDFVAYPEGGTSPLIMGLQRGYMVVPTIRIAAEPDDPPQICATLRLVNTLDGASAPISRLERVFTLPRVGDVYDSPSLENFLDFERSTLIGHQLTMEVEIATEDFVARDTTTFELGAPEL